MEVDRDLRLAESLVEFLNGSPAETAFSWVQLKQTVIAHGLGILGKDKKADWRPMEVSDEQTLRRDAFYAAFEINSRGWDNSESREDARDHFLTNYLHGLQVVHFWRVTGGEVKDVAFPRLDTSRRCVAYVVGLALQDRHHLRNGIKRCGLPHGPMTVEAFRSPQKRWHFFIDLPNSKTLFCSPQHAATYRKRRERAKTARKLK